jgi:hypothetical protein
MIYDNSYLNNILRPYILDGDLTRYGAKKDGGYIVNKKYLNLSNVLYTYGVGNEVSFEEDFLNDFPEYKVHLYDFTINEFPELKGKVFNHKEGLAPEKNDDGDDFLNHLKINNDEKNNILLKIDAEGVERIYFPKIDLAKFHNIVQMVIEFHFDDDYIHYFVDSMLNINKYFYCIHIHENNCCGLCSSGIPKVIECSFINKLYVKEQPILSNKKYPIKDLDFPNNVPGEDTWSIDYSNL